MAGNYTSLGIGGGGIKSTQRGLSAVGTATLSPAVNVNKTQLRFLGSGNNAASTVVLTNSTTVTIAGAGSSISWEITEYF